MAGPKPSPVVDGILDRAICLVFFGSSMAGTYWFYRSVLCAARALL